MTPPHRPAAPSRPRRPPSGSTRSAHDGLMRRMRTVGSAQGPRVELDGKRALLLCSNDYLGLAHHPTVVGRRDRRGRALGDRRGGLAAGLREHGAPRAARAAARRLPRHRDGAALRLGLPGQHRHRRGAGPAAATSSSPTSSTTRASSTAAAWPAPRPSSTATATSSTSPGRSDQLPRPRRADRHRRALLDGRRRRAAQLAPRARDPPRREADGRRRPRGRGARPGRPRRGRRGGARRGGRRGRRDPRQGARQLRRLRLPQPPRSASCSSTPRGR